MQTVFQGETGGHVEFPVTVATALSGYIDLLDTRRSAYRLDGEVASGMLRVPRHAIHQLPLPGDYTVLPQVMDADGLVYFLAPAELRLEYVPDIETDGYFVAGSTIVARVTALEAGLVSMGASLSGYYTAAEINALLATEQIVRTTSVATLEINLQAEAAARQTADTTLQTDLAAETAAREVADTALQADLTAETGARQAADVTLQNALSSHTHNAAAIDSGVFAIARIPWVEPITIASSTPGTSSVTLNLDALLTSGYRLLEMEGVAGGGGGGGGGLYQAGSNATGGGGGASGSFLRGRAVLAQLRAQFGANLTLTLIVGSGSAGAGAATNTNTAGQAASNGGDTAVTVNGDALLRCLGGGGGYGGSHTNAGGGLPSRYIAYVSTFPLFATAGTNSTPGTPYLAANAGFGPGGGGAGGGMSTTNAPAGGAKGGICMSYGLATNPNGGSAATVGNAPHGEHAPTPSRLVPGIGGGGGGGAKEGVSGDGGNGVYGGGGGGGGGGRVGYAAGSGGKGGDGYLIITIL